MALGRPPTYLPWGASTLDRWHPSGGVASMLFLMSSSTPESEPRQHVRKGDGRNHAVTAARAAGHATQSDLLLPFCLFQTWVTLVAPENSEWPGNRPCVTHGGSF